MNTNFCHISSDQTWNQTEPTVSYALFTQPKFGFDRKIVGFGLLTELAMSHSVLRNDFCTLITIQLKTP